MRAGLALEGSARMERTLGSVVTLSQPLQPERHIRNERNPAIPGFFNRPTTQGHRGQPPHTAPSHRTGSPTRVPTPARTTRAGGIEATEPETEGGTGIAGGARRHLGE